VNLNGINLYLKAMIYKEQNKKQEAKITFAKALQAQPLLWSAWLELGSLLD
jgi:tetratricopeptide (TPR) repeat protein